MLSETVSQGQAGFPETSNPPLDGGPFFMARVPDDEIERLKKEIPIERLVKGFGV